jgi:hypothetical protein
MLFPFIGTTVILGMITGLADLNKRGFFRTLGGQIVHGALSTACLILVGVAFWRFGWKIGLLDFVLVIIAAKASPTLSGYLRKLSPSLASVKARRRRPGVVS